MNSIPARPQLTFSAGTLVLERQSPTWRPEQTPGDWVWDRRVNAWRSDALNYPAAIGALRNSIPFLEDHVPEWRAVHWPDVKLHKLRPDQEAAVAAWRKSQQGCVIMPTGTGKTEVALTIMAHTACPTLVVSPVRDLMYQWHRRIAAGLGYEAGIVGDRMFHVRPVSVTTYDSACIHMERFGNRFQLVIFDECHHLPGGIRQDAARMCAAPFRLGLTATPERSDGRHAEFDRLIGPIVYALSISDARGRTLADYEVVRIPVHLSDAEQRRYDHLSAEVRNYMIERRKTEPSFDWEDLCVDTAKDAGARRALQAYFAKQAIEDRAEEKLRVLEDLFRLHQGEPCLIFAGSNAMARDISRRFLIPCLLSHCGKQERREVLTGLETGVYPALVANQVLDEGVDLPEVKVAAVVGGTSSSRQAKQRLGRILRKAGNARAVLYEIVCAETNENQRSRQRRGSDAYEGTRHRRV